jgi:type VI secretion system secreted protein VgrG
MPDREFELTSPLSPDPLLFDKMTVAEELGRMFEIELEMLSEKGDIALSDVLGQGFTISVALPSGGTRYFHGLASRFIQDGYRGAYHAYRATLRPWLWFLTRNADCRIYQSMAVPDIVKAVFSNAGFTDYEDQLNNDYTVWDYRVQYRETTFAFVSRLMEHEGIYYFFKHEQGKHTLVLCDGPSSHAATSGYETVPYFPPSPRTPRDEHLEEWRVWQEVQPVKTTLNDYDFTRPTAALLSKLGVQRSHGQATGEIYDYPGTYQQSADGDNYVKVRLDELSAEFEQAGGSGSSRGLSAGALFTLSGYFREDQNQEYLIVGGKCELVSNLYESGDGSEAPPFRCQLRAIASQQTFRTARTTPKSLVHGPQTAVVVGPTSNEIYTDQYGRIKVQFFWDRVGTKNENSSCWVRVGQNWAGNKWGVIFLPRVGQEVIVDFLEGDPDQPIITGSVYNNDQMPPYALDANKTQSGIKTRSSAGATDANFNELRFEDKLGNEEVFFHAERDFTREVENDDVLSVGLEKDSDGNLQVGLAGKGEGNQTVTIFNNQTLTIGKKIGSTAPGDGSQTVEIWKNQTVTIGKGGSDCQDGSQATSIFKDQAITIGNNHNLTIGDSKAADGSQTVTIWKARTVTLKTGDDSLTVTQGNQTVQIKAGASSLEAMQSILLKVGENSIKIAPDGITIKGTLIDIQGSLGLKAKGLTTDVSGDAALTVKGGIVKIN